MNSINIKTVIAALEKLEPVWRLGSVQVNYPMPNLFSIFFTDEQGRFRQRIIDHLSGKTEDKILLVEK